MPTYMIANLVISAILLGISLTVHITMQIFRYTIDKIDRPQPLDDKGEHEKRTIYGLFMFLSFILSVALSIILVYHILDAKHNF